MCRQNVDPTSLVYITKSEEEKGDTEMKSQRLPTKEEILIQLISEKKDGKFIVYSSSDETFSKIKMEFIQNEIRYTEVKGSINTVNRNLERFRAGEIQVVFINSRHNAAGIDLVEATDIILYHEMNMTTTTQIVGRGNRIGRTIPLNVHYLHYV